MGGILAPGRLATFRGVSSLRPVSGEAAEIEALLREWDAAPDPGALVIETSGSTGQPKRVMLSRAALRASADATHARLGGPGRWELNLPPTYVAGVQVLFRTIRAGADADRSYISLVPTQLVRMREEWATLTSYDAVLIGGGPLDAEVRAEAEAAGVPIVQTYGMSETCGGCVYDGVPLDGVEVRIDDAGQVLLRGPVLFDGYQDEPDRTAAAFRDGWLVTNDLGHWAEDGRLRIDGRTDDVIITGGLKVPARVVAGAVAGHPDVEAVEVLGVPDPEWGERVVAFVVSREPLVLEQVRDLVAPRSWAPRQILRLPELPKLPNGKTDRVLLRKLAADD
ncbi:AMP-dependent synthetase [Nocardioides marmorisolisilvae]|uniref:AMP-dependent synthetase n=1 Tax=Nocardioides marmorisolisilvae TaxID=1542737 RepID=A0A3N0E001_9ACTN|nr:AMP-dependent synthetase [Nocardioides marmorisolisilvae]